MKKLMLIALLVMGSNVFAVTALPKLPTLPSMPAIDGSGGEQENYAPPRRYNQNTTTDFSDGSSATTYTDSNGNTVTDYTDGSTSTTFKMH